MLLRFFRFIRSGRNLGDEFVRKVIERHFVDFRRTSFLIQTHYALIRVVNLFTRMRKEHGTGRQYVKIVGNKFRKLMRIVCAIFQKSRFLIIRQEETAARRMTRSKSIFFISFEADCAAKLHIISEILLLSEAIKRKNGEEKVLKAKQLNYF